jgi:hypothetical protein
MESSPFPFQGPLKPEQVEGRDTLVHDLSSRIAERRVTALLGPRRFGKTSVLRRVVHDLEHASSQQTIWVDLYEIKSMADLASALDAGISATEGPLRTTLNRLAVDLKITLGIVAIELRQEKRLRPDPTATVHVLMDLILASVETHRLCLVFDEFSGITGVNGGAGLLRTKLQHHYQEIGLVFAGSEPSTMAMLFSDNTQPFFAQADLVEIPPLEDAALFDIVTTGFTVTGRDIGSIAPKVVDLAQGHPQRAMQLADALWRHTPPATTADTTAWSEALAEVRANADLSCERLYSFLRAGQQRVLRTIAKSGSPYGMHADVLDLAPGTAQAAIGTMIDNGMMVRRDGRLAIVDPLLADWLQRRFPL